MEDPYTKRIPGSIPDRNRTALSNSAGINGQTNFKKIENPSFLGKIGNGFIALSNATTISFNYQVIAHHASFAPFTVTDQVNGNSNNYSRLNFSTISGAGTVQFNFALGSGGRK